MTEPVAQPLSAAEEADLRRYAATTHPFSPETVRRIFATLDAARSGPGFRAVYYEGREPLARSVPDDHEHTLTEGYGGTPYRVCRCEWVAQTRSVPVVRREDLNIEDDPARDLDGPDPFDFPDPALDRVNDPDCYPAVPDNAALRERIETNLRHAERRPDDDFYRGKASAFRVVLSMLDGPPNPTFVCGRPTRG